MVKVLILFANEIYHSIGSCRYILQMNDKTNNVENAPNTAVIVTTIDNSCVVQPFAMECTVSCPLLLSNTLTTSCS